MMIFLNKFSSSKTFVFSLSLFFKPPVLFLSFKKSCNKKRYHILKKQTKQAFYLSLVKKLYHSNKQTNKTRIYISIFIII